MDSLTLSTPFIHHSSEHGRRLCHLHIQRTATVLLYRFKFPIPTPLLTCRSGHFLPPPTPNPHLHPSDDRHSPARRRGRRDGVVSQGYDSPGNNIVDFVTDAIISQMLLLDPRDSTKDVRLFINSSGGSLSFRKIGMEYVDMHLVHWPVKLKPWACSAVPNEQDFDKLDIVGTWAGMGKCLQMGLCMAIGFTGNYSILSVLSSFLVLLICVTKVAKSAFDKALAEHEDIYDAVGSEEPTERDHGVDLQQPLLIKIDSSDSYQK
ncbi:hypothetical protein OROMI_013471 [Orobanche minor]